MCHTVACTNCRSLGHAPSYPPPGKWPSEIESEGDLAEILLMFVWLLLDTWVINHHLNVQKCIITVIAT